MTTSENNISKPLISEAHRTTSRPADTTSLLSPWMLTLMILPLLSSHSTAQQPTVPHVYIQDNNGDSLNTHFTSSRRACLSFFLKTYRRTLLTVYGADPAGASLTAALNKVDTFVWAISSCRTNDPEKSVNKHGRDGAYQLRVVVVELKNCRRH